MSNLEDPVKALPPAGFCCWGLANATSNPGERGLSIVVEERPEGLMFWYQSRGVDAKDEAKMRELVAPIRINILATGAILHCPWCGRRLEEVAAAAPRQFVELAEAHRPFLPEPLR